MQQQKSFLSSCIEAYQERSFLHAYDSAFELVRAETTAQKEQVFRLRHDVFCEEHGLEPSPPDGEKRDCDLYDGRSVHYLLLHRPAQEPVGTIRLTLPLEENPGESFLIQKYCRHPVVKEKSHAPSLCEISRFCMSRKFRKRERDGRLLPTYYEQDTVQGVQDGKTVFFRRLIPYAPAALLQGAFEAALAARILEGLWMVDTCHLWSLERIGFSFSMLGPHVNYHGGAQPVIFNIKNVLDSMRVKNRHCWDVVSDLGRLQTIADDLARNDWQDQWMDGQA